MFPSAQKAIVASILLFLFPWSAVANVDTLFSLGTTEKTPTSIANNEFSSKALAAPPGEQKCWVDAYVNIFHLQEKNEQDNTGVDHHTPNDFCENATPVHKKALAFEVARCTLQDLGRSIINTIIGWNIEDPQECTAMALYDDSVEAGNQQGIFPNLELCLKYMTETGVHVYTQFFSHIVHTCNRLTHHLAITFQQQTATQLAKMSRQAMSHFNDIIHRQQETFYEREEAMRKQHEDFYAAMHEQHNELLEGHSGRMDEFKSWTSGVMRDWTERDQEHKKQHQVWIENQTAFLLTQVAEIERLRNESVASATRFLQPFMSMEFLISLATHGYTLLTFLFHFIGTFKITWLLTRPRRCHGFRGCLFAVVFMESLVELCVYFVIENGLLSDAQQKAFITSLRKASWCLEALIFVVGLLFSCCSGVGNRSFGNEYDDDDDEEDIGDIDQGLGVAGTTPAEDIQRQQIEMAFHRLLDEALAKRAESQVLLPTNMSTFPVAPRRVDNIHIPSPPHAPFFHGHHLLQPATLEIPPPPPMIYHRRSSSEPQVNRASIQYYGSSQVADRLATTTNNRKDDDKIGMVVSPLSNGGLFSPVRGSSSMSRSRLAEALEERATGNVLGTTNMVTSFRGTMNDVEQDLMVAPPATHQPILTVPPPGTNQDNNHRTAFDDDNHSNKKRSNEEMRAIHSDPKNDDDDDDNSNIDDDEDAESECSSQPKRRRIMSTEEDEAEMKMEALPKTASNGKTINTTGGYMHMEEEAKDEESGEDDFVSCHENDEDDNDNVSTKMDDGEMDNNDGDHVSTKMDDDNMDTEEEGHLDDV